MLNDTDTQAKRILLWQELLGEMPPEHRRLIEESPKGEIFEGYCAEVARRLVKWQEERNHAANRGTKV